MKKIQVLGVELEDLTTREAMRKVEMYLKDGKVSSIAYITTRGLMMAEQSEEVKAFLEGVDMTIAADSDILRASGDVTKNRENEIDNNTFMFEFMRKLIRTHKTVYLLTGTKDQLKKLEEMVKSYQENLNIIGTFSLDELEKDEDYLINEINVQMPNILISNLDSPMRESFFETNHMKLNADIWLMLKDEVIHSNKGENPFVRMHKRIVKRLFRKKVEAYQSSEAQEKKDEK